MMGMVNWKPPRKPRDPGARDWITVFAWVALIAGGCVVWGAVGCWLNHGFAVR